MTERAFWNLIRPKLNLFGLIWRVENRIDKGTPDVCYTLRAWTRPSASGWIELKHLDAWPIRPGTPVTLPHYTLEQVTRLEDWGKAGGRAFLFLRVGRAYILFRHTEARAVYQGLSKEELRKIAILFVEDHFPLKEVVQCLTSIAI